MTILVSKTAVQALIESGTLQQMLAINSPSEFAQAGLKGTHQYHEDGKHQATGITILSTPQQGSDEQEESQYLEVVKLYGVEDLPFRVSGVDLFEDVYDQSSSTTLKDFRSLSDAIDYAFAAHETLSFDDQTIQAHLDGKGLVLVAPLEGKEELKQAANGLRNQQVTEGPSR